MKKGDPVPVCGFGMLSDKITTTLENLTPKNVFLKFKTGIVMKFPRTTGQIDTLVGKGGWEIEKEVLSQLPAKMEK